jgi:hypothetical protein
MRNEKQFNRKVEMNNQLKTLQQQLDQLTSIKIKKPNYIG